jgi:hypothetical protein
MSSVFFFFYCWRGVLIRGKAFGVSKRQKHIVISNYDIQCMNN